MQKGKTYTLECGCKVRGDGKPTWFNPACPEGHGRPAKQLELWPAESKSS